MAGFDSRDRDGIRKMVASMGPGLPDQMVRQAIQFCWIMMPPERQHPLEVAEEMRRILERALRDFTDDASAFMGEGPGQ